MRLPAWQEKDDDGKTYANPQKFFDKVRQAKLHERALLATPEKLSAEDTAILAAYREFPRNPRAWELAVRKQMGGKGDWKVLDDKEKAELAVWRKVGDVWDPSSHRLRQLLIMDRKDMKPDELKELLFLRTRPAN
jgi:hypothetical protein